MPAVIPKILVSCPYDDRVAVQQLHRLLQQWPLLPPEAALEVLDSSYADPVVRRYAVACIDQFADGELADVLLQVTAVSGQFL